MVQVLPAVEQVLGPGSVPVVEDTEVRVDNLS